jgi:DNA-binding MarR family transcriptional regulator
MNDFFGDGIMVRGMIQRQNDCDGDTVLRMADDRCIPRGHESRTALMLASVGSVLVDLADNELSDVGVDGREYSILAILQEDAPGSQQEIAKLHNTAPALVVSSIDDLEGKGLVERTRDPADRRRSRVTLTKKGEKTLAAADRFADATVAGLLTGLDGAELQQLHDLLAKGLRFGLPEWPEKANGS